MRSCNRHGCPAESPIMPVWLCLTDDRRGTVWVGQKTYQSPREDVDEAFADAYRDNPGLQLDALRTTSYAIERNGRIIRWGRAIHYDLPPWFVDGAVLQKFFDADDIVFTIGDRQYDNRSL